MSKWFQDKETFARDGRAIQGTVPIVRMDDADGCAYAAVVSVGASEERVKAIAALITAAPELLEACKALLDAYNEQTTPTHMEWRAIEAAVKSAQP